jgi:site-specific recombinase XerD
MMDFRRTIRKWGDMDMAELDLVKLISHFAQSNKAEGKSPKTVSWYSEMLFDFVSFLRSTDRRAILAELNAPTVREFIVREQGRGLSPYTVQRRVRDLKALSSWLFAEGYTPDNVLANVKLPKVPATIVKPLTPEEIDRLISVQNPLTAIGSRNIALLITLLDADRGSASYAACTSVE